MTAKINKVFLPTNFTQASYKAFIHALKLTVMARANLTLFHVVSKGGDVEWSDFPSVSDVLDKWNINLDDEQLADDDDDDDRFNIKKMLVKKDDPVEACRDYFLKESADLVVMSTHRGKRGHHWLGKQVAKPIAKASGELTLFVPVGIKGFVSADNASLSLKKILIPIDLSPRPQKAVDTAINITNILGVKNITFYIYHCGKPSDSPVVSTLEKEGWNWEYISSEGDPATEIIKTANDISADLIVMTTRGKHGFLDAFRGHTSERVLHETNCPLAIIPPAKD